VIKVAPHTYARLIEAMLDGVYTCSELAEHTGLHYVTVLEYTRELHRKGACHIDHFEKDLRGRDCVKVYRIGRGKDAKRQKLSGSERQRRTRAKRRELMLNHVTAGTAQWEAAV